MVLLLFDDKNILAGAIEVVVLARKLFLVIVDVAAVLLNGFDLILVVDLVAFQFVERLLQAPLGEEIVFVDKDHVRKKQHQRQKVSVSHRSGNAVEQGLQGI